MRGQRLAGSGFVFGTHKDFHWEDSCETSLIFSLQIAADAFAFEHALEYLRLGEIIGGKNFDRVICVHGRRSFVNFFLSEARQPSERLCYLRQSLPMQLPCQFSLRSKLGTTLKSSCFFMSSFALKRAFIM